jgi:hypothetical protein
MKAGAAVAVVAAAISFCAGAAAAAFGTLPSPTDPIRSEPPLAVQQSVVTERRFPSNLRGRERVRVGVDRHGRPVRIVVLDTIEIFGKGDYTFGVPGPIEDVAASPGSDSTPGLRSNAVIWQGFSPGRRLLGAIVTLRAGDSAAALPLRVEIHSAHERTELVLRNDTRTEASALVARVPRQPLAAALDAARHALVHGEPVTAQVVPLSGPASNVRTAVSVPLEVRGRANFERGTARIAGTVTGHALTVTGRGKLTGIELEVRIPDPVSFLTPPGRSWRTARTNLTTLAASRRLLTAALASQYQAYLANPDPAGRTASSYEYRLAKAQAAVSNRPSHSKTPWLPLGAAFAFGLAAVGALVLWAHS